MLHRALNSRLWESHQPVGGLLLWQDWALACMLDPCTACTLHDLARMAVLPAAAGPSLTKRLAGAASRR